MITVGQKLYSTNRRTGDTMEHEVTKVGNKYFYCGRNKFDLNTLYEVCDFMPAQLYVSKQALSDKIEADKLFQHVRKKFDWAMVNTYTLNQLRRIHAIINEP
jgi:hypothetical protein